MFVNPKTKIYTSKGYRNISTLKVGDKVLTHKGNPTKIVALNHREVEEDQRSKEIKTLYETKEWTYEQLGEKFRLSAASICHIIRSRVGYDVEVITVGYSPYSKDCIQITPDHKIMSFSGKVGVAAKDIQPGDIINTFQRDRESGEISFEGREVVTLRRRIVRSKYLYDLEVEDDNSYIAKGIVNKIVRG